MKLRHIYQNAAKRKLAYKYLEKNPDGTFLANTTFVNIIYLQEKSEIIGALNFEVTPYYGTNNPKYIWVDEVRIFEENNQGRGYGTKLMKYLFKRLNEMNLKIPVRLKHNNTEIAKRFFLKLHFKEIDSERHFEISFADIEKYHG